MSQGKRPTLEQKRAAHAWNVVSQVAASQDKKRMEEFALQSKKLTVRVLTSGLGPALAFLEAKDYARDLREALNDWIATQTWASRQVATSARQASLIERIIQGDSEFLRLATDEVVSYMQWLVRFTEAKL
jgi:CRISPR type III-B/RAMP module-associated protein Cmr5